MEAKKFYKVKFKKDKLNTILEFHRDYSACSPYGNKSAVTIMRDGDFIGIADTRYDDLVMRNFGGWCLAWVKNHFNPEYIFKIEEIVKGDG